MRERESVSLTPALSRCLSLFAHYLRYTRDATATRPRRFPSRPQSAPNTCGAHDDQVKHAEMKPAIQTEGIALQFAICPVLKANAHRLTYRYSLQQDETSSES